MSEFWLLNIAVYSICSRKYVTGTLDILGQHCAIELCAVGKYSISVLFNMLATHHMFCVALEIWPV